MVDGGLVIWRIKANRGLGPHFYESSLKTALIRGIAPENTPNF